jgi:hypothetical protein
LYEWKCYLWFLWATFRKFSCHCFCLFLLFLRTITRWRVFQTWSNELRLKREKKILLINRKDWFANSLKCQLSRLIKKNNYPIDQTKIIKWAFDWRLHEWNLLDQSSIFDEVIFGEVIFDVFDKVIFDVFDKVIFDVFDKVIFDGVIFDEVFF